MHKKLLSMATLGALASAACAQSSVTAFGIVDANLRHIKNDGAGALWSMGTDGLNQSRLGFRGVEDLGGGLQASFWLEAAFSPTDGSVNPQRFWHRRSTVSLSSSTLGELRLGRDHTATFWNLLVFDPFPTGLGNATLLFPARIGPQAVQTLLRADRAVNYLLPKTWGGLYGQVTYAFGEAPTSPANSSSDINRYVGARLGYALGPLDTAIAYGQTRTATTADIRTWDLGISYDFGAVKLYGLYAAMAFEQWNRKTYMLGATVPVGVGLIRASVARSRFDGPACPATVTSCDGAATLSIGYVHHLSKRTALYTTASRLANDNGAAYSLPGGRPGLERGGTSVGFEMGMRHAF